jgi:uncharacterized repeat protein (TIGR03803 family)
VIYKFKGVPDGQYPTGNLIFDAAGNLYGTTLYGGSAGAGSVFEVTPTSGRGWTESTLYSFQGGTDGAFPVGTIVFDTAGNLYGVTENGGTGCDFSCGTVFELSPGSGGWSEKVLYSFQGQLQNPDAAYPTGGLIIDSSGNLYGATAGGGAKRCSGSFGGCGTIFELSRVSGGWVESVLYPFQGGSDGQEAMGVVLDPSGNLFGTTQEGGSQANCGTVFKLTPHAGGKWTNNVLHRFTCGNDGGAPAAGVVLDAGGNVYGTAQVGGTYGTVFKLARVSGGKWAFRVLHGFTGNRDGGDPEGSVILDATGTHLYGTTNLAGDAHYFSGLGMVFEITP